MASLRATDPATGEILGEVPVASASEVEQAVQSARAAQAAWAGAGVRHRLAALQHWRHLVTDRADEIALLITRESGKPLAESRMSDVLTGLETARHLVRHGARVLRDERVRIGNPLLFDRRSIITREPLGVVGVISPWNYPFSIPATGVLSALAAGNSVVLKPSEHTPLVGQWIVDTLHEAGVPDDVLHIVHGAGDTGRALAGADLDGMIFTGSVATGQAVAASGGPERTTILELGGKDPLIALDSARVDGTVAGATWGAFTNAGQTCASVERMYVPAAQEADYLARLGAAAGAIQVGIGTDRASQMGPLIVDAAVDRVTDHIRDAEAKGARVIAGGHVRDDLGPRFFEPTVLADVDHSMTCMRDETFGPTLPVMSYAHVDEAVGLANDSEFGLTASVWGATPIARAVAERLEAGTVAINDCLYTYGIPEAPWGGWKQSGVGATHGELGLLAVTKWRHLNTSPRGKRQPWNYPYDASLDDMMQHGTRFLHARRGRLKAAPKALRGWLKRR